MHLKWPSFMRKPAQVVLAHPPYELQPFFTGPLVSGRIPLPDVTGLGPVFFKERREGQPPHYLSRVREGVDNLNFYFCGYPFSSAGEKSGLRDW